METAFPFCFVFGMAFFCDTRVSLYKANQKVVDKKPLNRHISTPFPRLKGLMDETLGRRWKKKRGEGSKEEGEKEKGTKERFQKDKGTLRGVL